MSVTLPVVELRKLVLRARRAIPNVSHVEIEAGLHHLGARVFDSGAEASFIADAEGSAGNLKRALVSFAGLLAALPGAGELDGEMAVVSEGLPGRLDVVSGWKKASIGIVTVGSTEWPNRQGGPLPAPREHHPADVMFDGRVMSGRLWRVLPFIAPDDNRYGLNGAHIEAVLGGSRLLATDGNRLTWQALPGLELPMPKDTLLPRWFVSTLAHELAGAGRVSFWTGDGHAQIATGDAVLTARLLNATFPDYRQVMPRTEEFAGEFVVDRGAFARGLREAMPLTESYQHTVGVIVEDGVLTVKGHCDRGRAEVEVLRCSSPAAKPFRFWMFAHHILEALETLPEGPVRWRPNISPTGPHVLVSTMDGPTSGEIVIMPCREP